MSPDGLWSIGELAEHARVTVKTVRFYSDRGLLPQAPRSSGGHRRYGPGALEQLRTIRALRALDLPVPDVARVLDGSSPAPDALAEAVDRRLGELGDRIAALRWQEAALQLVRDCPAGERAERLRLVGSVGSPPDSSALARFWRGALPARLSRPLVAAVLDHAVPQPPSDPTPAQVLAFARLHAIATAPCPNTDPRRPARHRADRDTRPDVLYAGLFDAYPLAAADLRARRAPGPGQALDCFVAAHAAARAMPDGPEFRRRLSTLLARGTDPMVERYWELTAELAATAEPTLGAAHAWMRAALATDVAATAC